MNVCTDERCQRQLAPLLAATDPIDQISHASSMKPVLPRDRCGFLPTDYGLESSQSDWVPCLRNRPLYRITLY